MRYPSIMLKVTSILIGFLLFQLLFFHRFLAITIAITGVLSLINLCRNKIFFFQKSYYLFLGLYILYVAGVLWSQNLGVALFDLEVKLSFLVIPIIFGCNQFSRADLKRICNIFIYGAIFVLIGLLIRSATDYFQTGDFSVFFYREIGGIVHPSYLGFYLSAAKIIVITDLVSKKNVFFNQYWQYLGYSFFLSIFCVLLLSKSAIISVVLIDFVTIVIFLLRRKWLLILGFLVTVITIIVLIFNQSKIAQNRIGEVKEVFKSNEVKRDEVIKYQSSTPIRWTIWKESLKLIGEKPFFGYGTGDVKDELMASFLASKNDYAYQKRLNAHNQFLQTTIAIGLVGLFVLFGLLILPFTSKGKGNWLLKCFCIISTLFFLTESALETQAGVIGFVVFFCLFDAYSKFETEKITGFITRPELG